MKDMAEKPPKSPHPKSPANLSPARLLPPQKAQQAPVYSASSAPLSISLSFVSSRLNIAATDFPRGCKGKRFTLSILHKTHHSFCIFCPCAALSAALFVAMHKCIIMQRGYTPLGREGKWRHPLFTQGEIFNFSSFWRSGMKKEPHWGVRPFLRIWGEGQWEPSDIGL